MKCKLCDRNLDRAVKVLGYDETRAVHRGAHEQGIIVLMRGVIDELATCDLYSVRLAHLISKSKKIKAQIEDLQHEIFED